MAARRRKERWIRWAQEEASTNLLSTHTHKYTYIYIYQYTVTLKETKRKRYTKSPSIIYLCIRICNSSNNTTHQEQEKEGASWRQKEETIVDWDVLKSEWNERERESISSFILSTTICPWAQVHNEGMKAKEQNGKRKGTHKCLCGPDDLTTGMTAHLTDPPLLLSLSLENTAK